MTRYFVILENESEHRAVQHFIGFPDGIRDPVVVKQALTPAHLILLSSDGGNSGWLLDRYDKNGNTSGDTWHETLRDSRAQASFEYGITNDAWFPVPDSIGDHVQWLLSGIPTHCCRMMLYYILNEDEIIYFWEKDNMYLIPVHDGGSSGIIIRYCPWCGTKLPEPNERLDLDEPNDLPDHTQ